MKIFYFILPILGFLLVLSMALHMLRQHRPPSVTISWLMALLLLPYVAVPLYIMLGTRKQQRHMSIHRRNIKLKMADKTMPASDELLGIYPLHNSNHLDIFDKGDASFQAMTQAIQEAKCSILITTYIFATHDQTGKAILNLLIQQLQKGVHVYLLMDAMGSFRVSKADLAEFKKHGGHYAFFSPMSHLGYALKGRANLRNHRKMMIIDQSIAFVGGMNIAEEYLAPQSPLTQWRDLFFRVTGTVVDDLCKIFHSDWDFTDPAEPLSLPTCEETPTSLPQHNIPLRLIPSGPDVPSDTLYDLLLTTFFHARTRIWIVTPYFLPDELMMKALCIAARRGIDVRLLIPFTSNHLLADLPRGSYLRELDCAGAKIFLYQPRMLHAKIVLIDEDTSIIGSANMDMRSFFLNYELALFVHDKSITQQLEQWTQEGFNHSTLYRYHNNLTKQILEGAGRMLVPLL